MQTADGLGKYLQTQPLDTNISPRPDRKFVYFSPSRLERGLYEPDAIMRDFAPMRLNVEHQFSDVQQLLRAQSVGATQEEAAGGPVARRGAEAREDSQAIGTT
eukprot:4622324-Amphidinium_carterae.1